MLQFLMQEMQCSQRLLHAAHTPSHHSSAHPYSFAKLAAGQRLMQGVRVATMKNVTICDAKRRMERQRDDAAATKTKQKLLHLPRRRGLAQLVHREREGEEERDGVRVGQCEAIVSQ